MLALEDSLPQALRQWRLDRQDAEGFSLWGEFQFAPSFSGFAGHFPGQPVLPAVVQLAAVRHLAELALDRKLDTVRCRRVKFRGMLLPQETMQATIHLSVRGKGWQADFSLHKDGTLVAGGLLDFACRQEGSHL